MPQPRLFNRAVIRLSPTDDSENVRDFLQGLVTNDVTGALPVWAGLLSAQGKAMFDFLVWPGEPDSAEGSVLIDCEADAAGNLVKRLSLYRLRRKITIERDDTLGVYWQIAPDARGHADPRLAALGNRWLMKTGQSDAASDDAWLAHRLALGVTEGASELTDILWLETNAADLHGVSFEKGCYIGQENTARMNWRQKVNRRLVVIPIAQSDEKRRKASYPELGLAVDHLRVADIVEVAAPEWMSIAAGD